VLTSTATMSTAIRGPANDDPKLDGVLSLKDLAYEEYGWEVHPFLEVVVVEGVAFSHYFTVRRHGSADHQRLKPS
jgi:hypothetical protein